MKAIVSLLFFVVGCGSSDERASSAPAERAPEPSPSTEETEPRPTPTSLDSIPPALVRLLIGGEHAQRIAAFLTDPDGPNGGCTTVDEETVCGQVIDVAGNARGLAESGAAELLARADTVLLSEETNEGERMLRVRVQGSAATTIAELMNYELAQRGGGVITGVNHSCVVSSTGQVTCGFILDRAGNAYHLEQFGYD